MAVKSKHIPVYLSAAVYEQLKAFAEQTDRPVSHVAEEAIADWLPVVGRARLEYMAGNPGHAILSKKILHMAQPARAAAPANIEELGDERPRACAIAAGPPIN